MGEKPNTTIKEVKFDDTAAAAEAVAADANHAAGQDQPAPPPHPLTIEKASRLATAIRRLSILKEQKIVTEKSEAEKRGIQQFLLTELTNHADELVGNWFAVHNEYQPLVDSVATLLYRAGESTRQREERRAALLKQHKESQSE